MPRSRPRQRVREMVKHFAMRYHQDELALTSDYFSIPASRSTLSVLSRPRSSSPASPSENGRESELTCRDRSDDSKSRLNALVRSNRQLLRNLENARDKDTDLRSTNQTLNSKTSELEVDLISLQREWYKETSELVNSPRRISKSKLHLDSMM